jgi:hypothetical protein
MGGKKAEGGRVARGLLDFARTGFANGIGIEQQAGHPLGGIGRVAAAVAPVMVGVEGAEVELAHEVGDETGQMAFRQSAAQRGRQEELVE